MRAFGDQFPISRRLAFEQCLKFWITFLCRKTLELQRVLQILGEQFHL